jgi:hypothetical protein
VTDDKARGWGSGHYTTHVYAVEARAKFGVIPLKVGKPDPWGGGVNPFASTVLTPHEWTRVHAQEAPIGVPNGLGLYAEAASHGFMSYQCAMAIACWFQALHDAAETRLVMIEFKSSYETKEIGVAPAMNLFEEDRELYWHLTGKNGGKVRSALPVESATSADAVDPQVTDSGKPTTRV